MLYLNQDRPILIGQSPTPDCGGFWLQLNPVPNEGP